MYQFKYQQGLLNQSTVVSDNAESTMEQLLKTKIIL